MTRFVVRIFRFNVVFSSRLALKYAHHLFKLRQDKLSNAFPDVSCINVNFLYTSNTLYIMKDLFSKDLINSKALLVFILRCFTLMTHRSWRSYYRSKTNSSVIYDSKIYDEWKWIAAFVGFTYNSITKVFKVPVYYRFRMLFNLANCFSSFVYV